MSVRINASGEYLRRTANLPTSTAFTICGWARMTRRAGVYQYMAGVENATSSSSAYLLMGYTSAGAFEITTTGVGGATSFSSAPTDGAWFFFALTCSGTAANTLNGYWAAIGDTSFKTAAARGASFTTALLSLGNDSYDEYCNAGFFAVKVYDAALTSAELWNEMQTIRPQRTANINIWSPLWDTSDVVDYSGNGRNWTAGGSVSSEDNPPLSWGAGSDTIQAVSALTPITGDLSQSIGNITLSASGALTITGDLSKSIGNITLSAAGTLPITGELSKSIGNVTLSAAGTLTIEGALSASIGNITISAAGTLPIDGALSQSIGAIGLSAAGESTITGELSKSIGDVTLSAAGATTIEGALSASIGDITLSAVGNLAGALDPITGELSASIGSITLSATGATTIEGALSQSIGSITLSAAGATTIEGAVNKSIGEIVLSAAGSTTISGQLAASIGAILLTASGAIGDVNYGEMSASIGEIQLHSSGLLSLPPLADKHTRPKPEFHPYEMGDVFSMSDEPRGGRMTTGFNNLYSHKEMRTKDD